MCRCLVRKIKRSIFLKENLRTPCLDVKNTIVKIEKLLYFNIIFLIVLIRRFLHPEILLLSPSEAVFSGFGILLNDHNKKW